MTRSRRNSPIRRTIRWSRRRRVILTLSPHLLAQLYHADAERWHRQAQFYARHRAYFPRLATSRFVVRCRQLCELYRRLARSLLRGGTGIAGSGAHAWQMNGVYNPKGARRLVQMATERERGRLRRRSRTAGAGPPVLAPAQHSRGGTVLAHSVAEGSESTSLSSRERECGYAKHRACLH